MFNYKPIPKKLIRKMKKQGLIIVPLFERKTEEQIFYSIKDEEFYYVHPETEEMFIAKTVFIDQQDFIRREDK